MLPAVARLRRREEFAGTVRRGRRVARGAVVVHQAVTGDADPARVGFVVGRSVGNSVVRHRVSRQLRHLMAPRLTALPPGTRLVVRAQPSAAGRSSAQLGEDLTRAMTRLAS